jgi:FlaA1/EpsC-like NDP-sugar epimerase
MNAIGGSTGGAQLSAGVRPSGSSLRLSPAIRVSVLMGAYTGTLAGSLVLAYLMRFDFSIPAADVLVMRRALLWVIPIQLAYLLVFRQFAGLLSFFSTPDLSRLFIAVLLGACTILGVWMMDGAAYTPRRGVILIDFIIAFVSLAAIRLTFRLARERYFASNGAGGSRARRVGIVGAGYVGASLARELTIKRGLGLLPVVFFDDDKDKWGHRVHDIPVAGAPEILLDCDRRCDLDEVIIAMPSSSAKRIGEVVRVLQEARIKFETVPSMDQLATGKVKVSQLRPVQIQDLLGRDAIELETENIRQMLAGRVVMVTGGGGSIGSELCRQIASFNPARLLVVDQSEVQLFPIEQELIELGYGGVILPLVGDILDAERMGHIFERFKPEVVYHAAAHKHVPMMEQQPSEAIRNNSLGTMVVAELALKHAVSRFVLISTDKAINPSNVMGATKRLAEIAVQALYAANPSKTRFMAVRFGNVLGSSGSVIPIFQRQIAAGGPVKVTHPDVTRYFMTIPEAVGLVLQSSVQGEGGEIFVLDMGKPVKIVDLARDLIQLSGLRPDDDIEIEFTGLRPGEKLFEELSHHGENIAPTKHSKITRFVSQPQPIEAVRRTILDLSKEAYVKEPNELKLQLKKAIPEYHPYLT